MHDGKPKRSRCYNRTFAGTHISGGPRGTLCQGPVATRVLVAPPADRLQHIIASLNARQGVRGAKEVQ